MPFEKLTPPAPTPAPRPAPHVCELPGVDGVGPGSIWRCDQCRTAWVLNPASTLRFGLGGVLEAALLFFVSLPFLLYPFIHFSHLLFGWRRVRYIGALSVVVGVALVVIDWASFSMPYHHY